MPNPVGMPPRYILQIGQRFGRGTVTEPEVRLSPIRTKPSGLRGARLLCDCGNEYAASIGNLVSGTTKSCGCLKQKNGKRHRPLRRAWYAMKYRCENPGNDSYPDYGGRGIKVCNRWQDFDTFEEDIEREIGPRPDGMTLDRIDNNGNYEPGNVRWANSTLQNRNKRSVAKVSDEEIAVCLIRWRAGESVSSLAREHGVHNSTMNRRLHAAQDVETRFAEWWTSWSVVNGRAAAEEAARAAWHRVIHQQSLSGRV
jgi:hypothetical protein